MNDTVDLQSEQFMTLLTDALRSGPGSPEWNQAVKILRASNQNTDELQLLTAARENLEAGKEYRSVRAGPGFTQRVMEGIEQEANRSPGLPTANLIALIAAGAILVVVIIIGVRLLTPDPKRQAIDDLTGQIFGNKYLSAAFPGPATAPAKLPEGWAKFGDLPLANKSGEIRPAFVAPATESSGYKVGGIVTAQPVAVDQAMEVDASVHLNKSADDSITEVFVSDEPITDQNAVGGHALVWHLKAGEARVFLADGSASPQSTKAGNKRDLAVKLLLNRETAVVETAGQRLYAGPHQLAPDKPRYVGIRFRRHPGDKSEGVGVTGITIQKP